MLECLRTYKVELFIFTAIFYLFLQNARAQDRPLFIGSEDVLTIVIYVGGEEELTSDVTVSAQGTIDAFFIGSLDVAGLTPSQLEEKITKLLAKDYYVDPKVHVRIKEFHSISYYISGSISSPGLYEMPSQVNLLELIAKAGGISADAGKVAFIIQSANNHVLKEDAIDETTSESEPIKVDLGRLLEKGDQTQNPALTAGDIIYIPPKQALNLSESMVSVEGMINKPGLYEYQPGMTALNVCIFAGGFSEWAAPNRARIIRKKGDNVETIKINLNKVREGKIPDVELKPGDRIYIPETWF